MSTMVALPLKQVKCQCCLKNLNENEKAFIVTKKVQSQFKDFTQLKIKKRNYICVLCKRALTYVHCWIDSLKENTADTKASTKCNCCSRKFNSSNKEKSLSGKVRNQLVELIQSKFSKKVTKLCVLCKKELSYFVKLRHEFIKKQSQFEGNVEKLIKEEPEWNDDCQDKGLMKNSFLNQVLHVLDSAKQIKKEKLPNSKTLSSEVTILELHHCNICKIDYECTSNFIMHLQNKHNNVRNFKCELCTKAFKSKGHLKGHIARRHNDVRKHDCKECHRQYLYESHLKIHVRRYHNKERTYICQYCEKGFFDTSELMIHMKRHAGVNYYI